MPSLQNQPPAAYGICWLTFMLQVKWPLSWKRMKEKKEKEKKEEQKEEGWGRERGEGGTQKAVAIGDSAVCLPKNSYRCYWNLHGVYTLTHLKFTHPVKAVSMQVLDHQTRETIKATLILQTQKVRPSFQCCRTELSTVMEIFYTVRDTSHI